MRVFLWKTQPDTLAELARIQSDVLPEGSATGRCVAILAEALTNEGRCDPAAVLTEAIRTHPIAALYAVALVAGTKGVTPVAS